MDADRPKPRRRVKGERTEALFRDAARDVFASKGYLNTRVEDIAAKAEKSPGSFYNYFDSKEAVLLDLARDFHEQNRMAMREIRDQPMAPEASIRASLKLWVRHYNDCLGEMSGVFQASMVDEDFQAIWRAIRADAIVMISKFITRAQRDGFATGLDPLLSGSALSSMLEHYCFVWFAQGGDDIDVEFDEQRAVETLTALWYHGIYWQDG